MMFANRQAVRRMDMVINEGKIYNYF